MSRSQRVDFPAPGLPVTPRTHALPVSGQRAFRSSPYPGGRSSTIRIARATARGSLARTRSTSWGIVVKPPRLAQRAQPACYGVAIDGAIQGKRLAVGVAGSRSLCLGGQRVTERGPTGRPLRKLLDGPYP